MLWGGGVSRVRVIANIIFLLAGVLITIGGIIGGILFNSQLGLFYSTLVIGMTCGIGSLLLTFGVSCIAYRYLLFKSQVNQHKEVEITEKELQSHLNQDVNVVRELFRKKLVAKIALDKAFHEVVRAKSAEEEILKEKEESYVIARNDYSKCCQQFDLFLSKQWTEANEEVFKSFRTAWTSIFGHYDSQFAQLEQEVASKKVGLMSCSARILHVQGGLNKLPRTANTTSTYRQMHERLAALIKEKEDLEEGIENNLLSLTELRNQQDLNIVKIIDTLSPSFLSV